ncbi:PhoR protein [Halorhabdus tiamatea SARL4B]|uniref:histidine kinase n=1 Tax=Halorhabdus tiamatea SARL4B TaxID=1033806 RepID=F7PF02_9EURY|nr:PAS domain S-box protein [Halorhabdus tiamatea]ERJ04849.1 PhoR protein [Halorhabdus tiamatea SARL4B]CCQ32856.1 multi-sensor signal transduction histidine kinase [Halorhabdus tiamatea SARL4B]
MTGDSTAITVLHVDDEPDLAALTAEMLERDGQITVETATSASEGLDLLAEGHFDCLVSDYAMPGMDGIEFLEAVRVESPDLPFILYTGKGSEEVASEAITAGATDYLQKGGGTEQYDLLANRIYNAVSQYRSQQRAAKFDRIRSLMSDLNQILVRAESREAVESRVCERIVDTDRYTFAWIGDVDAETGRLEPRVRAGEADGYLEEITITADDSPTGQGPAGTAARERRVAVTENIAADPELDRWADVATAYGFESIAAVPLAHDETLYGVLTLYADEPQPFDADERDLLGELGDDIAHALDSFAIDEQRREERDRREALFANAPTPVAASRPLGAGNEQYVTDINDAFEDVFGFDRETLVGEEVSDVLVPEEHHDEHVEFRQRSADGEAITKRVERCTREGTREFLMHVIPFGLDDAPDGNYVWYTDVSDWSERERELRAFRQAVEHTGHAVYWTDPEGSIEYVNPAFEAQTGYVAEDAIGENASLLSSGEHDEAFYDALWETILDGETWEGELVNEDADGERYVVEQTITPVTDDAGEIERFVAINTDVTEREHRQRELETTNTVLRTIVENLPMGVLVEDADRDVLMVNDRLTSLLDVPADAEELIGQDCTRAAEALMDRFADPRGFLDGIDDRIDARDPVTGERLELADGRVLERDYVPYTLPDGEANLWLYRDVTERTRDRQRLKQQNERLDQFADVVSHDLRNPLNVASSRLELAAEECDSDHLEHVATAVERALSLVADLRALAAEGVAACETEPVDLARVAHDSWETVVTAEASLTVEAERTISADPGRLRQLLENLFSNAVAHAGADVAVTVGPLENGFFVADDGPGIPPDAVETVFEAGHSTEADGTGFGLAIVEAIAHAHGWTVTVTDREAGGARFEFTGVDVLEA